MPLTPHVFRGASWDFHRPLVVGIINTTPDSFSDGGELASLDDILRRADALVEDGADCLDIGGESTRPGAPAVSAEEVLARVVPAISAIVRRINVPLSIDTCKAVVARAAVEAGAEVVNDVSGGRFDASMLATVESLQASYICGHVPADTLAGVHISRCKSIATVHEELGKRLEKMSDGLRSRTILDPCLGFGKTLPCNIELMHGGAALRDGFSLPVLLGASRKRFLGELTGREVGQRDVATAASSIAAVVGGAQLIRVHNVAATKDALQVFFASAEPLTHG